MSNGQLENRVVSGMRPTGRLHLGHYHGALKNWAQLQHQYDCFFFVADWHALTTSYNETENIEQNTYEMLIDWFASGVSPSASTVFVQSKVPEHAELHVLLSMVTPLPWLERVPTYKDTLRRLNDKNLNTFGFLGYPVLQAADILMYRGAKVPVGADQEAHVEVTRDIARAFNWNFGRDDEWKSLAQKALGRVPKKIARQYESWRKQYVEQGVDEKLEAARALVFEQSHLSNDEQERLIGYLADGGRIILPEPEVLLTDTPKVPGLNGEKMSKSYNNTVLLREEHSSLEAKIRTMQTDPARARRSDPGDPSKCPVYDLHKIYSSQETLDWAANGCRSAGIGCIDCKGPLIDSLKTEQVQFNDRAAPFVEDRNLIRNIIEKGSEKARVIAKETLEDVRSAMGVSFR
ncbi:MAG: tryptophan--tRNA ligase [Gammaproteobacteria bacterium]|nr:tryptophan--tRNA ligase [Gammaproteobacteria bacterium]